MYRKKKSYNDKLNLILQTKNIYDNRNIEKIVLLFLNYIL